MARPYDSAEEVSNPGFYQSHIASYNTSTQTWQGHNTFVNTPTRKIQTHKNKIFTGATTRGHVARHNPKPGLCHKHHQRGHPLWHLFWSENCPSKKETFFFIVKKTNFSVMSHKYKSLLLNMPVRHIISKVGIRLMSLILLRKCWETNVCWNLMIHSKCCGWRFWYCWDDVEKLLSLLKIWW